MRTLTICAVVALLLLALALAGCGGNYINAHGDRDFRTDGSECYAWAAETSGDHFGGPMALTLWGRCMTRRGWTFANGEPIPS